MVGLQDPSGFCNRGFSMSNDRFPNIMAIFGFVDGVLGCVFGLLNLMFWLFLISVVISWVASIFS